MRLTQLHFAISGLTWAAISLIAAEQPQISILTIETDNVVTYVGDVTDASKVALTAGLTTPAATRAFTESITIGDVVKVNGRPAKGLWSSRGYAMGFSPTAAAGFAIADVQNSLGECRWEIQSADGKLVGRFVEGGLAPHQLTGGSGIFFGAQGQQSTVQTVTAPRRASMTEDPSLRRSLGGGVLVHTFHVAPAYPPAVAPQPDNSPAVFHSANFAPVTDANPAHPGETLTIQAMNLGLTIPAVDPGTPFNAPAYNWMTAPAEVLVNGQAVDAFDTLGWPGLVNLYRVDFVMPSGTAAGSAGLQIRVSGIAGPAVKISVK
ncbi:MAG TPA: hypothetical protein VKT49_05780 [Bryobacteraceae bacterium]|nr:hypothetical protein [Bryobacteraceae bacterium]